LNCGLIWFALASEVNYALAKSQRAKSDLNFSVPLERAYFR